MGFFLQTCLRKAPGVVFSALDKLLSFLWPVCAACRADNVSNNTTHLTVHTSPYPGDGGVPEKPDIMRGLQTPSPFFQPAPTLSMDPPWSVNMLCKFDIGHRSLYVVGCGFIVEGASYWTKG